MGKASEGHSPELTFGEYLARLRTASGMTLRQVEDATNREVSNAYLSQLENNKILKPSPNILHALSVVYRASYEELMQRAGYISTSASDTVRKGNVVPFSIAELTPQEENALLAYLAFYRKEHKKK
jgi:transcriptional regulator with XRE-family HTH domain